MAEQDQDQKTEQPSAKRLEEAREHGQLPISREAAMWASMLGVLLVMGMVIPSLMRDFYEFLRDFVASAHAISINEGNVQNLFFSVLGKCALISGVAFLILVSAIVTGFMAQTGFFFSLDLMTPDFARLSPMRGLHKLFSLQSVAELVKSLLKLLFLGGMVYTVLWPIMRESPNLTGFPIESILAFVHKKVLYLIEMLLLVFTIIAALDLFYTHYQYIRGLKMTKTEVKDEYRQQEGDPMVKSRLRQIRIEKTRKRMMAQVPKADVIITNPTHYAVALQYEMAKMAAPTVVAKGINMIADRIREIAEESNVPIVSNPPLARALYGSVEIDQQIPGEHYRAVAEIISYVYKIKKKKP
ncbi:MAG: flagellar biosynthesis protein FlhB [Alphaproteobacteria bacterium]|nr:flagellar biosynthesis protein FlhB [Alphaproteobacteria bacterium]